MTSQSASNLAAWQSEPKGPIIVEAADIHEPGKGEVRIRVMAAPIQPADAKQAYTQIMPRFKYPGILGSQCAGIVDKIGEGVTKVQVGDRVAAGLNNYANGGDPARASHQRYAIAEEYEIVGIGNDLSFPEAVSINTQTPAGALFKVLGLERPVAPPRKPEEKGQKILIWGGSSAMGALSICYAKLAGYVVVTTCNPANFDLVKERGADHVFDRNDPEVVEKIVDLLPIKFWFDTISLPESITQIIKIATVQYDRIEEDVKLLTLLPATAAFSPGMPDFPPFIKAQMHFFRNKAPENQDHMQWLMGTPSQPGFLEQGLREGWIKGVPSKSVGGLAEAGEALKMVWEGKNSGCKIVVEPWKE